MQKSLNKTVRIHMLSNSDSVCKYTERILGMFRRLITTFKKKKKDNTHLARLCTAINSGSGCAGLVQAMMSETLNPSLSLSSVFGS